MRRLRDLRWAALIGLVGLGGATGCTHYHYYGAPPQMLVEQPAVVAQRPVLVPYGSVCDVPSGSSSGVTTVVEAPRRGGEVIVSRPQGGLGARRGSRFAWHRPNPDSLATTRVEGGLDESAVR
jgi:hypothetical protein